MCRVTQHTVTTVELLRSGFPSLLPAALVLVPFPTTCSGNGQNFPCVLSSTGRGNAAYDKESISGFSNSQVGFRKPKAERNLKKSKQSLQIKERSLEEWYKYFHRTLVAWLLNAAPGDASSASKRLRRWWSTQTRGITQAPLPGSGSSWETGRGLTGLRRSWGFTDVDAKCELAPRSHGRHCMVQRTKQQRAAKPNWEAPFQQRPARPQWHKDLRPSPWLQRYVDPSGLAYS